MNTSPSSRKKLPWKNPALLGLIVGKIKDETCGVPVEDFAGLKSNIYIYIYIFSWQDNHDSKKAKGANKNIFGDELKYKDYKKRDFQ